MGPGDLLAALTAVSADRISRGGPRGRPTVRSCGGRRVMRLVIRVIEAQVMTNSEC